MVWNHVTTILIRTWNDDTQAPPYTAYLALNVIIALSIGQAKNVKAPKEQVRKNSISHWPFIAKRFEIVVMLNWTWVRGVGEIIIMMAPRSHTFTYMSSGPGPTQPHSASRAARNCEVFEPPLHTDCLKVVFRWFKFTLKPPYSITLGKLWLAIWDTSFWTFWLKFGHKGPWDIS